MPHAETDAVATNAETDAETDTVADAVADPECVDAATGAFGVDSLASSDWRRCA